MTTYGGGAAGFSANTVNQYSSITGTNAEAGLHYDLDGNTDTDGTWSCTFDAENRLTQMVRKDGAQTLQFAYDYLGRRVQKTVRSGGAGAAVSACTKFVWKGWQLVAELDGGTGQTSAGFSKSYLWGPDLSGGAGAGGLLAARQGGATYYPVNDLQGNITGYLNASGGIAASYEYNAFGQTIAATGAAASFAFGYSGQYTDRESGWVYFGMRFYNPRHSRFVNRDPIEEQGGANLYAYCRNAGVNAWDTLGLNAQVLVQNRDENGDKVVILPPYVIGGSQAEALAQQAVDEARYRCTAKKTESDYQNWITFSETLIVMNKQTGQGFAIQVTGANHARVMKALTAAYNSAKGTTTSWKGRGGSYDLGSFGKYIQSRDWATGPNSGAGAAIASSGVFNVTGLEALAAIGALPKTLTGKPVTITQEMLVTAYCDKGPGSDWAHFKGKDPNVAPGSVGPGTIAVANAEPEEWSATAPASPWYPYGSKVTVFGDNGKPIYSGTVHDTGAGWDVNHHNVEPGKWIDVWVPTAAEARKFGTQTLTVTITYPLGQGPE